jgi:lysophospholipase L1-like esterase
MLKKTIAIIFFSLTMCACSEPPSPSQQGKTDVITSPGVQGVSCTSCSVVKNEMTLLIVGDSLSAAYGIAPEAGWVHLLEQRLQDKGYKYQVINASISGDTTSNGRSRLAKALQQYQPAIVVLELGNSA